MNNSYDWKEITGRLNKLLKLRNVPIGMKLLEKKEDLINIPKIRIPQNIILACQAVGQAVRQGWTVGVSPENFPDNQCAGILGLVPRNEEWLGGKMYTGVWYDKDEDSAAHQRAHYHVPYGKYEAMVVSPLTSNRLNPPDVCLFYATPGQMFIFIAGLQYSGFQKFEWSVVGESTCSDAWGRAIATGKPSMSLPCFGERRYSGVNDDEMLMTVTPEDLLKAIDGMESLSKNGLRYPIPPYSVQVDVREGLQKSYTIKNR